MLHFSSSFWHFIFSKVGEAKGRPVGACRPMGAWLWKQGCAGAVASSECSADASGDFWLCWTENGIEFDSEHFDLNINTGRGKSEIPTVFKSKSRKLVAPQHLPEGMWWQLHPGDTSGIPGDSGLVGPHQA